MIFQIQLDHLLRMNKNQWSNFILFLNDNFVTIYSYVIIHFNWNERKTGGGGGGIILAIKFELPKIQIFNVVYFKWNINPCCIIPKNTSSQYQNQSEIIECNTLRKLLNIITYDLYILCIILPFILHRSKQHKLSNKNISHERSNETSINPTTPKPEPWLKPKLSQDIPPPPKGHDTSLANANGKWAEVSHVARSQILKGPVAPLLNRSERMCPPRS